MMNTGLSSPSFKGIHCISSDKMQKAKAAAMDMVVTNKKNNIDSTWFELGEKKVCVVTGKDAENYLEKSAKVMTKFVQGSAKKYLKALSKFNNSFADRKKTINYEV